MTSKLNALLLQLPKRAESSTREKLSHTFVDVGPLFTLLSSVDHQIVFGRRGTGKTHVLSYLAEQRTIAGDVVAQIDLRSIGSNGGLYSDDSIPVAERATRLLVDALLAVHDSLLSFFVEHAEKLDLSQASPALDRLAEAITQVRVVGEVEQASQLNAGRSEVTEATTSLSVDKEGLSLGLSQREKDSKNQQLSAAVRRTGTECLSVNFGSTGAAFRDIASRLRGARLWVLLDEWSSLPIVLQPILADLVRRTLLPVTGLSVKIAAIEQRSRFLEHRAGIDYVGIELGADMAADVNLDDFMVFDNEPEKAKVFFQSLIARHLVAIAAEKKMHGDFPMSGEELFRAAFTEKRAIEEFVRACEGVPRDAINILSLASQRADERAVSVQDIRVAAKNWFQRDKDKAVSANDEARRLLHWIIDRVIGDRRARAFLVSGDVSSDLIEGLYDARVLHLLKRGISTHDEPGVRYDVYKLDYGCYVDLVSTAKAPVGLLLTDNDEAIEVPPDDYRSIRRAILRLEEFA